MTTLNLAQVSTTAKSLNDSSLETPPLSSIDYLYQAIALIEAKNAAINSSTNQNSVKQPEPTKNGIQANYSNATIAAAAAAAVAAKNFNGSFIYRNPQLQQHSSLPDKDLKELIPSHYQNLGYFNRETTTVNLFSRDQVEIQCLNQFCDCRSHMNSKCTEESIKSNSRLGKAKDFARRAVNIGDDYSDVKIENLENCSDSLSGSSRDQGEDSKELPSSSSTTSTPSPLATSSPINTYHFHQNHGNNHIFRKSSLSSTSKTANNIGVSTINSFEILKNILPIYLNSYLKTLSQSLINSVPTSTQEQAAYIQTVIDLINSIASYQQQNHEINHQIGVPQHSNFQNPSLNFLTSSIYYPPTLKSTSSNRSNIIEPTGNCYESSIPINTRSNLIGKDKSLFLRKKKLTSIMKPNQKFNNSKYSIASQYNHVGINLQNIKRNLFNSVPNAGSSLMPTSFIEVNKDALNKVEEHFKRSLGQKYFEYLSLSSLDC